MSEAVIRSKMYRASKNITQKAGQNKPRLRVGILLAGFLLIVAISAIACAGGQVAEPVEGREVKVPDEVSHLDSAEVERRLGNLLNGTGEPGSQGAQEVEPTATPGTSGEPTLEEILDLLNSATVEPGTGEITISISPATLSRLANPVLTIKSRPLHGTATVVSVNKIVYVPDSSGAQDDSFEYELFDGAEPVFSQVVEVR